MPRSSACCCQAGQFALERDAAVFGLLLVRRIVEFEQRGEAAGGGFLFGGDTQQRQRVEATVLLLQALQCLFDLAGQFVAAAGDQLAAGVAEAQQLLAGGKQRRLIVRGVRMIGCAAVLIELRQCTGHLALGLQQQALWIARQLAGGEQIAGGETAQLVQAGLQPFGESGR